MEKYGFQDTVHSWFSGYLDNRKQNVILDEFRSDWQYTNAGVPRGSVLGPLDINGIVENIQSHIKIFADNTSVFVIIEIEYEAVRPLNMDLEHVSNLSKQWCIDITLKKQKACHSLERET